MKNFNILVTSFTGIGDSVLCMPFLYNLHEVYKEANIFLVVPTEHVPVFHDLNFVNILPFNPNEKELASSLTTFANSLPHVDLAFSPAWNPSLSALFLNHLSGAKHKVAYSKHEKSRYFSNKDYYDQTFGKAYEKDADDYITDFIHNPLSMYHELYRKLFMLESFCKVKINYQVDTLKKKGKRIVFGLGGRTKNKKYPLDKWMKVIDHFKKNYEIVLLGDENDTIDVNDDRIINLIGKTSLTEVIEIINNSSLYVGHDSSLVHIAWLMCKLPCIVLYKEAKDKEDQLPGFLSYYLRYKPLTKSICLRPDFAKDECKKNYVEGHCCSGLPHCIKYISPTKVINAINNLLKWIN